MVGKLLPANTSMVENSKPWMKIIRKAVDPYVIVEMFGISLCFSHQVGPDMCFVIMYVCPGYHGLKPTEKNLHAVKRIFQYLRGTINMGLWYSKDSCIALTAFVDADHAGCQDTRKSTVGSPSGKILLISYLAKRSVESMLKFSENDLDYLFRVEGGRILEVQNDDDTLTLYSLILDDGIVSRLKFVRIGEDYQEYGLVIPDVMLNDAIKKSESYQMFIKYSTGKIPPKKSRGKGSQGKKTINVSQETVDVSEESEPEPEPVKKKTSSRRVVKKNVIISAADNIIPDPDVALELGKSISLTEAAKEEAARRVHATHARIMIESVLNHARIQFDPSQKLKGTQSLTPKEQEAADTMKALKESNKTSKRQPGTRGSNEGTITIPRVPDESIVFFATSKSEYLEEDKSDDKEKNDKDSDDNDDGDDHISDIQDTDDEDAKTESNEDEIYKYKIRVHKDKDVKMSNAEVEDSKKYDAEISDVAQANSLLSTIKDNTDAEINSLLEVTQLRSHNMKYPFPLSILYLVNVPAKSCKLEKDVYELKNVNLSTEALATLKSQVPNVVDDYLGSKLGDALQKTLQKHSEDIIQKHSMKPASESSKIQTQTVNLK
ncbi:hypothetical protein Tco_0944766 [Tanacetum coccineum]